MPQWWTHLGRASLSRKQWERVLGLDGGVVMKPSGDIVDAIRWQAADPASIQPRKPLIRKPRQTTPVCPPSAHPLQYGTVHPTGSSRRTAEVGLVIAVPHRYLVKVPRGQRCRNRVRKYRLMTAQRRPVSGQHQAAHAPSSLQRSWVDDSRMAGSLRSGISRHAAACRSAARDDATPPPADRHWPGPGERCQSGHERAFWGVRCSRGSRPVARSLGAERAWALVVLLHSLLSCD